MAWFSKIEQPLVKSLSMYVWQMFADDLMLFEATRTDFKSLHDCFTRKLKPEARPITSPPETFVSPCDAIIGSFGRLDAQSALQVKGSTYEISDLLQDTKRAAEFEDCAYITLRLKSSMYHRFHSPTDGELTHLKFIPGDMWNVNPPTLERKPQVFCQNERAVIDLKTADAHILLVPVAAILVASLRLKFLDCALNMNYTGPQCMPLHQQVNRGEELGHFEHGSTIVMLIKGAGKFSENIKTGRKILMGEPLWTPQSSTRRGFLNEEPQHL